MRDNTNLFLYIVIAIVVLHFLVGIGFLIYKINSAPTRPRENSDENEIKTT